MSLKINNVSIDFGCLFFFFIVNVKADEKTDNDQICTNYVAYYFL